MKAKDKREQIEIIKKYYTIHKDGSLTNKRTKQKRYGYKTKDGYLHSFVLREGEIYFTAHTLVAHAFLDNPNDLLSVCFVDGDRFNPHLDNILWRRSRSRCKINQDVEHRIFKLFMSGKYTNKEISELIGVSPSTIAYVTSKFLKKGLT